MRVGKVVTDLKRNGATVFVALPASQAAVLTSIGVSVENCDPQTVRYSCRRRRSSPLLGWKEVLVLLKTGALASTLNDVSAKPGFAQFTKTADPAIRTIGAEHFAQLSIGNYAVRINEEVLKKTSPLAVAKTLLPFEKPALLVHLPQALSESELLSSPRA